MIPNGINKEYYIDGKIKTEKEYINGKIWNMKKYDVNNNIIHEFHEGNGYMKEYNEMDKLIFEGNILNGKRNGICKEYYNNDEKLKFESEFLND